VIVGLYVESGQTPCEIIAPWIIIGAQIPHTAASTGFRISAGTAHGTLSSFTVPSAVTSSPSYTTSLHRVDDEALTVQAVGDTANGLSLLTWDTTNHCWVTRWGRTITPLMYTSTLSTGITCGRSAALSGGEVIFPRGVWVGATTSAGARKITNGTAKPTTGEWAVGDVVFNRAPSVGAPLAWICTAAGTPGTWAMTAPLVAA
jgi:hypothetical protein